jgi:hypothetical protein
MRVFLANLLRTVISISARYVRGILPRALIILSFALVSSIASSEIDPFRTLLKARSSAELVRAMTSQRRMQRQRLVCDNQLKIGKIPTACFQVLKLESEQGAEFDLDSLPVSHLHWLEELCEKRVKSTKDWRELDEALARGDLPPICQRAARLRLEDLKYAAQTENPAELFKRRFADRDSANITP